MRAFGDKVCCIQPGLFKTPLSNPAKIMKEKELIWNKLPLDIKKQYGEGYFQKVKGGQELRSCSSLSLKTVKLNLADPNSIARAVVFVTKETAGKGLFGLVSNAEGTAPVAPTDWLRIEDFHLALGVGLLGLIEITLKLLPLLKKAEGRVVNLINAKGLMAFVGGGYSLSKWGMEAFSDTLRYKSSKIISEKPV
ncbi:hypothetical protein Q9233_008642 [Columba guinea]|nr:hypothetical protein Q9233_008642 [Columba guinea]